MTDQSNLSVPLPGQKLEEAGAEVATAAGKSIIRGIGRVFGAAVAEWIARKEAKAYAVRLAIENEAQIAVNQAIAESHRQNSLKDIDHEALIRRRAERLYHELGREQANFEAIASRALEIVESSPKKDKASEIDEDWLFQFARYAEQISDKTVQELWARILSAAATEEEKRLSPAALQLMTLLNKKIATDFGKFAAVVYSFGKYLIRDDIQEPQDIDLSVLEELGLAKRYLSEEPATFEGFNVNFHGKVYIGLTNRGFEIFNAIFCDNWPSLTDDLQQTYLCNAIDADMMGNDFLTISSREDQAKLSYAITLSRVGPDRTGYQKQDFINIPFSSELKSLLERASHKYGIKIQSSNKSPI